MTEAVRYEVDDGVAWVTIDRPEARNALNAEVRAGLFDAIAPVQRRRRRPGARPHRRRRRGVLRRRRT